MPELESRSVEICGKRYHLTVYTDDTSGPPWAEEDGHGEVTDWLSDPPGSYERVLMRDRNRIRCYLWDAAIETALKDKWAASAEDQNDPDLSPEEQAERAVQADYDRLYAWANGDWCYVVLRLQEACPACSNPIGDGAYLGGVESDCIDAYLADMATELMP